MLNRSLQGRRAGAPFRHQLLHAAASHRDQCELSSDEEAVGRDEYEHEQQSHVRVISHGDCYLRHLNWPACADRRAMHELLRPREGFTAGTWKMQSNSGTEWGKGSGQA